MSTITSTMPPAPAMPAWIPSPLYRMTVEEYEAMVASGAFKGATGSISSTDTWWRR